MTYENKKLNPTWILDHKDGEVFKTVYESKVQAIDNKFNSYRGHLVPCIYQCWNEYSNSLSRILVFIFVFGSFSISEYYSNIHRVKMNWFMWIIRIYSNYSKAIRIYLYSYSSKPVVRIIFIFGWKLLFVSTLVYMSCQLSVLEPNLWL